MFSNPIRRAAAQSLQRKAMLTGARFPMKEFARVAQISNTRSFSKQSKNAEKPMSVADNFANGTSAVYVDQMYDQWRADPNSVHSSWAAYFNNVELGAEEPYQAPPSLGRDSSGGAQNLEEVIAALQASGFAAGGTVSPMAEGQAQGDAFKVMAMIRAFMTHGHLEADLDPLQLDKVYDCKDVSASFKLPDEGMRKLLDHKFYGFTEADLDRHFYIDIPNMSGITAHKKEWQLRELIEALKTAYCNKIGIEYMHIPYQDHCNWIRNKFELFQYNQYTKEEKTHLLDRLLWTDGFAQFITAKFNTMKRFGLEGCESFIPGLKVCVDTLMENGAHKTIFGMPHRGRLNMLANVVRKPCETIFAEFQGIMPTEDPSERSNMQTKSGDVKYHLGTSYTRNYADGKSMTVEILANPSHLECINPVTMGKVRAEQHYSNDEANRTGIVPILIHGDAAFAGQGVVYESMQMQGLQQYTVGGTIHVIVNNQIGFTTTPNRGRSAMYCSDLAKAINAPIFHVNADSMEDVAFTFKAAAEYRQKFNQDVIIDLIGYRKMGHNELDQPAFTQPFMYKQVASMKPVARLYEEQLLANGTVTPDQLTEMKRFCWDELEKSYAKSKTLDYKAEDWMTEDWEAIKIIDNYDDQKESGITRERLVDVGDKITALPEDAKFHRLVKKIFDARSDSIKNGVGIDWGTAEALAFSTLIQDGYHVRISGQDVERGTFSHRHAHVFYQDQNGHYTPINNVVPQGSTEKFLASNSHLSEFAVLGYELGYAQAHPNTLCLWEAQFGDFANGAQVIIDQFISSGEAKWNVKNGLVMLLPHGYDGAGPEHSSSRVERFLQLCDQDEELPENPETYDRQGLLEGVNMEVCFPSTAANYFHLLRTHMRMPFRKPLIVVSPKKLLRLKGACSTAEDFVDGQRFKPVIEDKHPELLPGDQVTKVLLCSGQVYYDLEDERQRRGRNDVAILRVESLCPFPFKRLIPHFKTYKNASVTWVQEEPKNAGCWLYVEPRVRNTLEYLDRADADISYAGRPIAAATAVGFAKTHNAQLAQLLEDAFA